MLFCAADHLCHYFLETLVSFAQQSVLEFLAIICAQKINVKNCTNFHTKFDLILISPNPPLLITIFTSQHAEVDVLPIYNFLNIF
jgi:hypothetical protein